MGTILSGQLRDAQTDKPMKKQTVVAGGGDSLFTAVLWGGLYSVALYVCFSP